MKFQSNPRTFTPITITLENVEEVVAVHALLNHARLIAVAGLPPTTPGQLRNANECAGNPSIDERVAEVHVRLCKYIS